MNGLQATHRQGALEGDTPPCMLDCLPALVKSPHWAGSVQHAWAQRRPRTSPATSISSTEQAVLLNCWGGGVLADRRAPWMHQGCAANDSAWHQAAHDGASEAHR